MTFPDPRLNDDIRKKLYPHQKDVIWRMLQGENVQIAHEVGAGKTYSMIIGAMEMKRLGLIRKPVFVVPNNIVEQFANDFRTAYSSANLLVLTASKLPISRTEHKLEFQEKLSTQKKAESSGTKKTYASKETEMQKAARLAKRKAILSSIATGDWDGIIISHNLFQRLAPSPETINQFYREMIEELEAVLNERYGDAATDKRHKKLIENMVADAKERLKRDVAADKKEIAIPFEELGIDQIFVDESDMFKNLRFFTNYGTSSNKTVGVSTTNAERSTDLYLKTRWLARQRNGGGVVFATGTPISNTLNEVFTTQKYLAYERLKEQGLEHFDNWAGVFCEPVKSIEVTPTGESFRTVTRLQLVNVQGLRQMYDEFADVKMAEDLPHLEKPELEGGDYIKVTVPATKEFKAFQKSLVERAQNLPEDRRKDNMLKITGELRKATLHMGLIDPSIPEETAGLKIYAGCDSISKEYTETKENKGTQLVFLDLGIPKGRDDTA